MKNLVLSLTLGAAAAIILSGLTGCAGIDAQGEESLGDAEARS